MVLPREQTPFHPRRRPTAPSPPRAFSWRQFRFSPFLPASVCHPDTTTHLPEPGAFHLRLRPASHDRVSQLRHPRALSPRPATVLPSPPAAVAPSPPRMRGLSS
jgi:hypothetical protein